MRLTAGALRMALLLGLWLAATSVRAEDAVSRVLAEAAALGLVDPDTLLINGASNDSRTPLEGSITTWLLGLPGQVENTNSHGDLETRVIGAMNTASMTLAPATAQAVLLNTAQNRVPVRAAIHIMSNGAMVASGGKLQTSAIGASNFGGIDITVGP